MSECGLCFGDPSSCGCPEWLEYWNNLTDSEREYEWRLMERHAAETWDKDV